MRKTHTNACAPSRTRRWWCRNDDDAMSRDTIVRITRIDRPTDPVTNATTSAALARTPSSGIIRDALARSPAVFTFH